MTSPFEFGAKLPIDRVVPKHAPRGPAADAISKVDTVAADHGFISREPVARVERIRTTEPIDVLSVKGPLSVINRFKQYCNDTGNSYWRSIDEFLRERGYN